MNTIVGIDISKQSFDVYFEKEEQGSHLKLLQTEQDYQVLLHLIGKGSTCVMEATGNYHLRLAHYLYHAGVNIIVENPLKIKRFSQMNLNRTKTDKADAKLIYDYANMVLSKRAPQLWQPDNIEIGHLKQYDSVCQQLIKQRSALSNSEEALTQLTGLNKEVTGVLKDMLLSLESAIKQLEHGMLKLVKAHHQKSYDLVTSIPGIGPKTATMMICITDGFNKFTPDHVKQFISYIGMSPRTFESGTSVQGRAHISKVGNSRLRSMLYMCSWTAKRSNQQCATLYERLHEKGKPEKVIKIAICHKLIRQIFGVVKSGSPFSNEFA
jgi:transposase